MLSIKLLGKLFLIILTIILLFFAVKWAQTLPKKMYPQPYQETVEKYAQLYNIDPLLVYATMKAESRFNENAVSKKGALGLMQLTESTAYWAAQNIGISVSSQDDILKYDTNIQIGTWFLSYLMKEYDGDVTKVLCAYNAGSGNVTKWLTDQDHSNDGVNLNNIPFPETKTYVEKVYNYYNKYKKIYGE